MKYKAFILMGSNIQPEKYMKLGLEKLKEYFQVLKVSKLYKSEPVVRNDVPKYLNAAVLVMTKLDPLEIKYNVLRKIEKECGRIRTNDKFDPRTIDLDIVLYNNSIINDKNNKIFIPDPDIEKYPHIAVPLAEIDPEYIHPVSKKTLKEIADEFKLQNSFSIYSEFG